MWFILILAISTIFNVSWAHDKTSWNKKEIDEQSDCFIKKYMEGTNESYYEQWQTCTNVWKIEEDTSNDGKETIQAKHLPRKNRFIVKVILNEVMHHSAACRESHHE